MRQDNARTPQRKPSIALNSTGAPLADALQPLSDAPARR